MYSTSSDFLFDLVVLVFVVFVFVEVDLVVVVLLVDVFLGAICLKKFKVGSVLL